jgi:hypothetical protein
MLCLPSVLYGTAKVYQSRRTCREVQEKVQYRITAKLTGNSYFQFFLGKFRAIINATNLRVTAAKLQGSVQNIMQRPGRYDIIFGIKFKTDRTTASRLFLCEQEIRS